MIDFEKLIQTLPEYKTLVFQHGERLFIKRDGEYEVLAVRLAYRLHVMATMTHVVAENDGVLHPNTSGERSLIIADYDLYIPIQSR